MQVSASILSVKEEKATQNFYNLEVANVDFFHIDVMDGKFVKNDTSKVMKDYALTLRHISQTPLDVHLMVEDLEYYINEYLDLKPDYITFHYEACKDSGRILNTIKLIQKNGVRAGLAIKPKTNVNEIMEFLPFVNVVLVMSVEPGEGGQMFMESSLDKIRELRNYLDKNSLEVDVEVDGGINDITSKMVKEAGADIAVVGTYLVNSKDYSKIVKDMR